MLYLLFFCYIFLLPFVPTLINLFLFSGNFFHCFYIFFSRFSYYPKRFFFLLFRLFSSIFLLPLPSDHIFFLLLMNTVVSFACILFPISVCLFFFSSLLFLHVIIKFIYSLLYYYYFDCSFEVLIFFLLNALHFLMVTIFSYFVYIYLFCFLLFLCISYCKQQFFK